MATQDFMVRGRGTFPFDMLRYDECFPVDAHSTANLFQEGGTRAVKLRTNKGCTPARWDSFMWKVVEIDGNPLEVSHG